MQGLLSFLRMSDIIEKNAHLSFHTGKNAYRIILDMTHNYSVTSSIKI